MALRPVAAAAAALRSAIVYVTCPSMDVARSLASGVVTGHLAACVSLIPQVTSIYEWQGRMEESSEVLMMMKTRLDRVDALAAYVKQHHPYTVAEIIATEIAAGDEAYLSWVHDVAAPGRAAQPASTTQPQPSQ